MEIEIFPYKGAGDMKLGANRAELRTIINSEMKEFKRSKEDESISEYYRNLGIFCYYKENDICNAIEFCEPALPLFKGQKLLDVSFNEAKEFLEQFDDNMEIDSSGLTSYKLGIGLYVEYIEDGNEPVETVIVFEKDYYQGI